MITVIISRCDLLLNLRLVPFPAFSTLAKINPAKAHGLCGSGVDPGSVRCGHCLHPHSLGRELGHRPWPGASLWCWQCQCLWREGDMGTIFMNQILSPKERFCVLQSCKSQRIMLFQPLRGQLLRVWDDIFYSEGLRKGGRLGWAAWKEVEPCSSPAALPGLHWCNYEVSCWVAENKWRLLAKEIECWILKLKPQGRASWSHH